MQKVVVPGFCGLFMEMTHSARAFIFRTAASYCTLYKPKVDIIQHVCRLNTLAVEMPLL